MKKRLVIALGLIILLTTPNCTGVVLVSQLDYITIYGIKESQVRKTVKVKALVGDSLYKVYYRK